MRSESRSSSTTSRRVPLSDVRGDHDPVCSKLKKHAGVKDATANRARVSHATPRDGTGFHPVVREGMTGDGRLWPRADTVDISSLPRWREVLTPI